MTLHVFFDAAVIVAVSAMIFIFYARDIKDTKAENGHAQEKGKKEQAA